MAVMTNEYVPSLVTIVSRTLLCFLAELLSGPGETGVPVNGEHII